MQTKSALMVNACLYTALLLAGSSAPRSYSIVSQTPQTASTQPHTAGSHRLLQTEAKLADIAARLERDVPRLMKEADVPGVSIALIRDGNVAWRHAFGVRDSATGQPALDSTVFEAASLSKPVFAYAVMKLYESGKIDLDKPLNSYLPGDYDIGPDPRLSQITARRVLSHTTGLPNWRPIAGQLKIFFTPGERFSYSGEGFVYLSKVVEYITGEKLNDFMKRTVFDPLEMTSSSYVWQTSYDDLKATRHNFLGKTTEQFKPTQANAAASLHTTAQDYGRFVAAILNGTGLKKETVAQMLAPQIQVGEGFENTTQKAAPKLSTELSWGLGVGLQKTEDGISFWHWGDNGNTKAFVVAFPRQKLGVVVFTNSENGLSIMPEIVEDAIGGHHPAFAWMNYESYNSPPKILLRAIVMRGAENALRDYRQMRSRPSQTEPITEAQMNRIGYQVLYGLNNPKDAILIFKLNVEDHPQSFNTYDSLGEAYMVDGQKELSIKNYERSLELNPNNTNGTARLKKLREQ
ncbi:MAG TPA: serine hydrolase [Blastocatellia bacterium]|nr:serine hydrolase [Blastocatellia bacterium]